MRELPAANPGALPKRGTHTVDVVVFAWRGNVLAVLTRRGPGIPRGGAAALPSDHPRRGEVLDEAARRVVRAHVGAEAPWMEQLGAFAPTSTRADLAVCFVAVVSQSATGSRTRRFEWTDADGVHDLPPLHREMVAAARAAIRLRMDHVPIAFRMLPTHFTLSELQQVYELLLGRPLHKASFRRALHAAWLVEPTGRWRGEGRGRPAQLFRFSPRRIRKRRRGVKFDLL